MRHTLAAFLLIVICASALAESGAQVAPDWTLETADARSLTLSEEVPRQTTVLFFWATWCPYCKALMPHLQSIELEYGDHVQILAISVFDDGDPAGFVEENGYEFTVLVNGDKVAEQYGISGTPGVLIVDRDRRVRFDLRGLPPLEHPVLLDKASGNRKKAGLLAPWWAAQMRQYLDLVLADPRHRAGTE